MKRSLQQIAEAVGARLIGEGGPEVRRLEVSGVSSPESATPDDLVFVDDDKHLAAALKSRAGAIIAGEFAIKSAATVSYDRLLMISNHPKLAFARAARFLRESSPLNNADAGAAEPGSPQQGSVHSTAVIHPSATLGQGVVVEARAVVGQQVQIGENTRIAAGCVIGAGVKIGRHCEIYPNVTIYPGTTIGDRVIVHAGAVLGSDGFGYVRDPATGRYEKFPQIGRLEIEDDVEIGANSTIDRGALDVTRIARGTKIDNLVHIGHNCEIGEDVVIAAQTGLSGSAVLERGVVVAGQVGIADHVRVEAGAILGAQCGVPSKKVIRGKGMVFWGTPARPIQQYLKELAVLARLAKKK